MSTVHEEWRPVVGYEGWYEVSSHGRVRRSRPGVCTCAGRILKASPSRRGYRVVSISKGKGQKRRNVHHLVARAFLGERPNRHSVNHKDGNKLNNRVENLEYVTHADNMRHAAAVGLMARGTNHPDAQLTEHQAYEIRIRAEDDGESTKELAKEYGVSHQTITHVVWGRTWRHVGGPIRESRRCPSMPGEENPNSKMTTEQVLQMREEAAAGATYKELQAKYGVSGQQVWLVITGRRWGHVGGPLRNPPE